MRTQVQVVSICDVLPMDCSWEEGCELLKNYCNTNNAHYYSAPRESFNTFDAVYEAWKLDKTIVVVEDLS